VGILSWVVVGVGAGATAKLTLRHPEAEALIVPLVVGSAGAVAGGCVATWSGLVAVTDVGLTSLGAALAGALAALLCYRVLAPRRSAIW
jgi:uncharacterized membrane protein YeaQ/YmgE (transglycosylase-associated protein family)